jgi:hypothetical protein
MREHDITEHCPRCWKKHKVNPSSSCRGHGEPQMEFLTPERLRYLKDTRLPNIAGRERTWWELHGWVVTTSAPVDYDACKCSKLFWFPACTSPTG